MFFFAGLLAAGAQNNPAPEQGSSMPNALQGFARNRNEPIKIDANRLEVHDKDKLAVFSGNVYVQQGDTNMRCPELKVFYEGEVKGAAKNSGAPAGETKSPPAPASASAPAAKASTTENNVQQRIRRLEALGGVIVISKDQKATGDRADFDIKAEHRDAVRKRRGDARPERDEGRQADRGPHHEPRAHGGRDQNNARPGAGPVRSRLHEGKGCKGR